MNCTVMRKFPSTLLLILAFTTLQAQQRHTRDSLLNLVGDGKEDTAKVRHLLLLARYYERHNQDSSSYYLEKSMALSKSLNYLRGEYEYFEQGSIVSFTMGNYEKSMTEGKEALRLARQLKDSALVVNCLNNISIVYGYLGDFNTQLAYMLAVKDAVEAMKDSTKFGSVYHGLANCYLNLENSRKALEWSRRSKAFKTKYPDPEDYINRTYATLAQAYDQLQLNDSALHFYDVAIRESVRLNDKFAETAIYGYQGNLYARLNRFEDMLTSATKSLAISRELQSKQMVASALYNMAYAHFLNGNNELAEKNLREGLDIAKREVLQDELRNTYLVLSFIAARSGDFKTFVLARQKTDSLQHAVINDAILKSTNELEKKYESEKKDAQLALQAVSLQRQSFINYILVGGVLIFLITSLLTYRNYKQKQQLQLQRISELETERQLSATEGVLKGEEQERTRLAKDLHDGLGGMLSGIKYSFNAMKGNLIMTPENQQAFERSMDMLDSSIREMRRVAHNMMPETLVKFGLDAALKDYCNDIEHSGALNVKYQSLGLEDGRLDQTVSITVYRIVQELVTNTLKHSGSSSALVQVTKTDGSISITVEDEGKGFDRSILEGAKGLGWTNIKYRVDFLRGKLDVDSAPGKGTSVHIEFNV